MRIIFIFLAALAGGLWLAGGGGRIASPRISPGPENPVATPPPVTETGRPAHRPEVRAAEKPVPAPGPRAESAPVSATRPAPVQPVPVRTPAPLWELPAYDKIPRFRRPKLELVKAHLDIAGDLDWGEQDEKTLQLKKWLEKKQYEEKVVIKDQQEGENDTAENVTRFNKLAAARARRLQELFDSRETAVIARHVTFYRMLHGEAELVKVDLEGNPLSGRWVSDH